LLIVVDEATDMKWSLFLKKKSDLSIEMLKFLQQRKLEGNPVRFIRLDNSGENKSFQDKASTKGYADIKFEFTAPGTPQQNGVAERAFPTLLGRVRAMMNQAGFSHELRGLLWVE
jgi:transposase InsO family protein